MAERGYVFKANDGSCSFLGNLPFWLFALLSSGISLLVLYWVYFFRLEVLSILLFIVCIGLLCFFSPSSDKIIVCRSYLQLNHRKYHWSKINSIRLAWLKWRDGGKCPVLLMEFFKPISGGALHFKEPEKLAPMKPENVQEYILDQFSNKQYSEMTNAIALYKKVEPTIEIEAYVD